MNDVIDKSQELDWRKGPLINKHRMAHGDIQGNVTNGRMMAAWIEDVSIARGLIKKGFIDEYHLAYGLTLLELKNAFLGPLNTKDAIYALIDNLTGLSLNKRNAVRMYDDIMRQFKMPNMRIIECACNSPYPVDKDHPKEDMMPVEQKDAYRTTFDQLVRITDGVIAEIRAEIEKKGVAD